MPPETLPAHRDTLRRSWLYVPLHEQKFVDKALALTPDVVILDLEDGVPADRKAEARTRLPAAVASLSPVHKTVFVRLNDGPQRFVDLDAALAAGARRFILAKAEATDEIRAIGDRLRRAPATIAPELALTLESARAVLGARDLARADPAISTLIAGTEDLALDLGVEPGEPLRLAKQLVILAAAEAGLFASGLFGHMRAYADADASEAVAREAYRFGFMGASCIHPAQIAPFNAGFSPTADEVARAAALVDAYEARTAGAAGAIAIAGEMTDSPVVARARRILARAVRS